MAKETIKSVKEKILKYNAQLKKYSDNELIQKFNSTYTYTKFLNTRKQDIEICAYCGGSQPRQHFKHKCSHCGALIGKYFIEPYSTYYFSNRKIYNTRYNYYEYLCEYEYFDNIQVVRIWQVHIDAHKKFIASINIVYAGALYLYINNEDKIEKNKSFFVANEHCMKHKDLYFYRNSRIKEIVSLQVQRFRRYKNIFGSVYNCNEDLLEQLKKYGFCKDCEISIYDYLEAIDRPDIETLMKAKQYHLMRYRLDHNTFDKIVYKAIKFGMDFNDLSFMQIREYFDLLGLYNDYFILLGKDTNGIKNPKYLKFNNYGEIEKERNRMVKLLNSKRDELELKKQSMQNIEYCNRIKKYLGFQLGDENHNYNIMILPDIKAFKEEGDNMQHCVFHNRYYNHKNSLIFSVRNKKDNSRLETAEILINYDKKALKINQLYGFQDRFTQFHNDIENCINSNLPRLKKLVFSK